MSSPQLLGITLYQSKHKQHCEKEIYYSFLAELESKCRHTVIISGNHDSPAFLDAPAKLLNLNNIHVIGNVCENPKDEIITLYDIDKNPEMIVCAVPYLRDKDVRNFFHYQYF